MPSIELRYLGNAAFEITSEKGVRVLIDPCLTGTAARAPSPAKPEEISDIDLILVSHGASDHLGDTLELAKRMGSQIVCGAEVSTHLAENGIEAERIRRVVWGVLYSFKGLRVKVLESKHISFLRSGDRILTGVPLGFILYTESNLGIYHPGDTAIFGDLKLFAELYQPQIGLLPVGGVGGYLAELSSQEAALVAKWMQFKLAIPMHYAQGSQEPYIFSDLVRKEAPTTEVIILKAGEKITHRYGS